MTGANPPASSRAGLASLAPGLLLAALLASAGFVLADLPWVKDHLRVSALLLVILLGMLIKSVIAMPHAIEPGVRMAQRPVLRWAVAGLGFRLSVVELWKIGAPALGVVILATFSALAFGWWIARRFGISEKLAILLGVGGAICGASAIVAADTVVLGAKRDSAVAIGVITLFGTIGIVLYPILGHALHMPEFLYGVWDGASLHETAQVVAAGFGMSEEAARVATVVKLARIALLAPVVFWLAWSLRRKSEAAGAAPSAAALGIVPHAPKVAPVPWFLVLFLVFAAINSMSVIPAPVLDLIRKGDLWLLCVGMAGVGLQTGFGDLRDAGLAPVAAGAVQWVFLSSLAYGLARVFCR